MKDISKAIVIVTNASVHAVALKYEDNIDDAPVVIEKGDYKLAEKIIATAKEKNIPIIERKLLTRDLYCNVKVGEFIDEDYFKAVAEILAQVYERIGKTLE